MVNDLLLNYGLAQPQMHQVYDLSNGKTELLPTSLDQIPESQTNLGVVYPMVEGVPAIEQIMGPSYYPADNVGPRYFQSIELVVGTALRVHISDERFYVDVAGLETKPSEWPISAVFWDSLTTEQMTLLPTVVAEGELPIPAGFTGVWKCALRFNCGKDLPGFIEQSNSAPASSFHDELTHVVGAELLQIGNVY